MFTLPAAAPAPSILGTPVLIVYPFSVNGGDVSKEAGSRLAVAIATQVANLGGVDVKPATPGTERTNFLDVAKKDGADYYVAGFVTPLGDGVSVVEQLVSTQTGIVVFSNTAQIRTYEDASGQGDVLRDALLRHYERNLGAYAAPPPPVSAPSPTPVPGNAAQANLGRLFGHKQQHTATPAPASSTLPAAVARASASPSPSPAPAVAATVLPSPSPAVVAAVPHRPDYGVVTVGGPASDDRRSFTSAAIRNDIIANHRRVADAATTPQAACQAQSVGTVLGGNLSTRNHTILGASQTTATLELLAYDCAGNVIYRKTFAHDAPGDNWKTAVNGVVASAVATFLREPATGHHS
jgi:TolB-like protein